MRALLVCIALFALPTSAGQVYKCKGPKGEITYTNIKCPDDAPAVAVGHYDAVSDAVPKSESDRAPVDDGSSQANATGRPLEAEASSASAEPVGGYRCDVEGRTWIQATPCPATSTHYESRTVSGLTTAGDYVDGSVSVPRTITVKQDELSKSDVCSQLSQNTPTAEQGKDSDSAYERNKLRSANGCGR
jgi:hypothetical protein